MRNFKRSLSIVILIISISNHIYGKTIDDTFLYSTVYINNESTSSAGTGFIITRKVAKDAYATFLVSNKHVLMPADVKPNESNHTANALISINTRVGEQIERRDVNILLRDATGEIFVKGHPNQIVDVAVADISLFLNKMTKDDPRGSKIIGIPEERLATRDFLKRYFISVGDEAIMIGYPLNLVEGGHVIPVARHALLATPPDMDFHGRPIFLIDCMVISGSSGSPIILPIKPYVWKETNLVDNFSVQQNYVLGIAAGYLSDWDMIIRKKISLNKFQEFSIITDNSNLGFVFRAETIIDVMNLFPLRAWKE